MENLRKYLITEINTLVSDKDFTEVLRILNEGDYIMEISINEEIWDQYDNVQTNCYILGYIFRNEFVESREKLFALMQKKKLMPFLDSNLVKRDLMNLSGYLLRYGQLGKLENIIHRLSTETAESFQIFEEMSGDLSNAVYNIHFTISDNILIRISTAGGYNSFNELLLDGHIDGFNADDLSIVELKKSSDEIFPAIHTQEWFNSLEVNSRNLIIAGSNLLRVFEKARKEENKEITLDYSALLLPFIKAAECEIPIIYKKYKPKIRTIAKKIRAVLEPIVDRSSGNENEDYRTLVDFAKRINKNDTPNSITFFYCLLNYFELGSKLTILEKEVGFLPKELREYLIIESDIIEGIKELGKSRNLFIHKNIMMGDITFEKRYYDLVVTLKLLARLKGDLSSN